MASPQIEQGSAGRLHEAGGCFGVAVADVDELCRAISAAHRQHHRLRTTASQKMSGRVRWRRPVTLAREGAGNTPPSIRVQVEQLSLIIAFEVVSRILLCEESGLGEQVSRVVQHANALMLA